MATANIKITALSDITSANMTYNDLVAVVDMNGTPETKKANIQLVGNLILNGAGGSYFPAAAQAVLAQSVTNAAQPNITSVGTLSSLTVTANVTAGNLIASGTVNGVLVGEGGNISNVQVGNVAGLGNIATINIDGNVSNVFRGDGTFGPEGAGGNANYANFAGTAYAVDGANVSGEVGFAAVANSVALANVSGAGNIATVNLDGNASNVLRGDGTWDSDANSTYGDSNVVSLLGAFGSNTISTTGLITGDGGGLSNIAVANVTGLGNIAVSNYDGNASNVLHGDGTWSADATDYSNANVVSLLASFGSNTISTTGLITGDGGGLSNIVAANISGAVANATYAFNAGNASLATIANTAIVADSVTLANVSGAGNIASINLDGNASNILHGDGSWSADVTDYSNANVVSLLASFGSNTITTTGLITGDGGGLSNIAVANVTGLGNIATTNFDGNAANYIDGTGSWGPLTITLSGDGGNISNIVGANVTGEVTYAATANAVALANVSGAGNIASINLDGNSANYLDGTGSWVASTTYTAGNGISIAAGVIDVDATVVRTSGAQNISTTGNFQALNIVSTGVFTGDGYGISNVPYANITGTPTLGNIATVNLDGNASNVLRGDGTFAADANSSYGDSNVASLLASFGGNSISTTANISAGNINANTNGFSLGYLEIPQVSLTADDTIALEDSGKHFHSNTAGNITLTIPTNATVAFPVGTAISIVEEAAGNILVNAAAGVSLYLAGNSTAANRVLATYGMATIMKTGTDTWFINGTGVS